MCVMLIVRPVMVTSLTSRAKRKRFTVLSLKPISTINTSQQVRMRTTAISSWYEMRSTQTSDDAVNSFGVGSTPEMGQIDLR